MKNVTAVRYGMAALAGMTVVLIGLGGCGEEDPPVARDRATSATSVDESRTTTTTTTPTSPSDTTLMNTIGAWHNAVIAAMRTSWEAADSQTQALCANSFGASFTRVFLPCAAEFDRIAGPSLASSATNTTAATPVDTTKLKRLHMYAAFMPRSAADAAVRALFDSIRRANGLGAYYTAVYDSTWRIFTTSLAPEAEFESYLRRQLATPGLDAAQREFVRIATSVGSASRGYWEQHPMMPARRGTSPAGGKVAALPAWAAIDLAGALVGAAIAIIDGQDWKGILAGAAKGAASASLLRFINRLYAH